MSYNKEQVNRCFRWLASAVTYDYCHETIAETTKSNANKFYESLSNSIDWDELTREDLVELGFMTWSSEEDEYELWLFPVWAYPLIPNGMTVYDSKEREFIFNRSTCPFVAMYGYLIFGLRLPNPGYNKTLDELIEELPDGQDN